jgi:4-hydroxythreonine-4-phosphate dehydrogenase
MGEPAGIGGEIALAAWQARAADAIPPFFVIDDPDRLERVSRALGLSVPIAVVNRPDDALSRFAMALPVQPLGRAVRANPGRPDPANAQSVIDSIRLGYAAVASGAASALVTNPIQKATLYQAGFAHPGHTEYLAALAGVATPVMMLAVDTLRVVPVTVHVPLSAAVAALTAEMIVEKARITASALRDRFGIPDPRLAVAGLNPHAGENGTLGREEIEIIEPAIAALKGEGWQVDGPRSPDTMFHPAARRTYDVAICQYHDQALIPLKTIDYDNGVNVTLGLPIVRTSPDHGTALDIAGRGIASPRSLIAALKLAGTLARRG